MKHGLNLVTNGLIFVKHGLGVAIHGLNLFADRSGASIINERFTLGEICADVSSRWPPPHGTASVEEVNSCRPLFAPPQMKHKCLLAI